MPIYEYRCRRCRRRVSILQRSIGDKAEKLTCPRCGHSELDRLVSRVALLKSEEARLDALSDPSALGDVDENDPRSMARFMKKMASEAGEDLGDEFHEIVDRLESGQAPEDIEKTIPDLGPAGMDDTL
jgi:putative FmdB family regulatory protein